MKARILTARRGVLACYVTMVTLALAGSIAGMTNVAAQTTATPADVAATDYPNKPIRIIVPYAPGGGGDAVVRYMSDKLAERYCQIRKYIYSGLIEYF